MTIIVYGDKNDHSFIDVLFKVLARYGGVQLFSKDNLIYSSKTSEPKFFIYELDKLPSLIDCEGLFIFKKSFEKLNKFPEKFLPIVNEQNLNAIKSLEFTDQIVMTCGTSAKNTLSFSSISYTEAVVVLQRYLQTKNSVIEPHEFSIKLLTSCDHNILLQICAILLLSDIPTTNGYEI